MYGENNLPKSFSEIPNNSNIGLPKLRKIVDYTLIEDNSRDKLVDTIDKWLKGNWQPYGFPFIAHGEGWCLFYQAMVKYED